jgi:hypothetical protein
MATARWCKAHEELVFRFAHGERGSRTAQQRERASCADAIARAQGQLRDTERCRQAFAGGAVALAPDVHACGRVHEQHVRSDHCSISGRSPRSFPRLTSLPLYSA